MSLSEKAKLVQVSTSLNLKLGGPPTVVIATTKAFKNTFDICTIVFGEFVTEDENYRIEQTTFNNMFGLKLKLPSSENREILKNADILLLHGFYLYSNLISIFFTRTNKIFLMPHGSLEMYQEKRSKNRKRLYRILLRLILRKRPVVFIVASNSESKSVRAIFPKSRIEVVNLGIHPDSHGLEKSTTNNGPIVLYCMSRISHIKRIDLCIEALALLNSREKRYCLKIFGSGDRDLEKNLQDLLNKLGLSYCVEFIGFVDGEAKDIAIRNSDILLLPSENESFALAVAEAIAAGNPVVVSKNVAMHEFVDKHQTGITITSLNARDLAQSIEDVVRDYDKYRENCIKVRNKLYWDEVIKRWIEVLTEDGDSNEIE